MRYSALTTLFILMTMVKATSRYRKRRRIVWEQLHDDSPDNVAKQEEGMFISGEKNDEDLNVFEVGTIAEYNRELFGSAMSLSMSIPTQPPIPPTSDLFKPITFTILDSYCKEVYGDNSTAVHGHDVYEWFCIIDGNDWEKMFIPILDVCQNQWGVDEKVVLLGGTADDWACVNWDKANFVVVPILVVASDFHSNAKDIADAVESVIASMSRVQSWYERKLSSGKTFRLTHPILQLSVKSAEEWNELSCLTASPFERPAECIDQTSSPDRFQYYYEGQAEALKTSLPSFPTKQTVPIFIYTGPESSPFWLGAAAAGPYSVNPPNVAVCSTHSEDCGLYSIGHEIGHSFGLGHSCEVVSMPECYNGIMQNPPNILEAVLFEHEQEILDASSYFEN